MEIPISYEILTIVPAILYMIFCKSYRFLSLIKDPTCFKNQDLALTNSRYSFQNSYIIEALKFLCDDLFNYGYYFSKNETYEDYRKKISAELIFRKQILTTKVLFFF